MRIQLWLGEQCSPQLWPQPLEEPTSYASSAPTDHYIVSNAWHRPYAIGIQHVFIVKCNPRTENGTTESTGTRKFKDITFSWYPALEQANVKPSLNFHFLIFITIVFWNYPLIELCIMDLLVTRTLSRFTTLFLLVLQSIPPSPRARKWCLKCSCLPPPPRFTFTSHSSR